MISGNKNIFRNMYSLVMATFVKANLLESIQVERKKIEENQSGDYDALAKVERMYINLTTDIQEGMMYIKKNGEIDPHPVIIN